MSAHRPRPAPLEIRLLGPIEVIAAGAPVELGHLRQRSVLAVLALEANRVVTRERLVDRIWDDRPPPSARNLLYGYLGRLRARLAAATGQELLTRRPGGYQLHVEPEAVDLHRFTALVARARAAGDGAGAVELLDRAEALWRGPLLTGIDGEWLTGIRQGLADERLTALLRRNSILLRQADPDRVLPSLGALAAEHPADERVVGQLVLALHLAGRPAQALAAYADARHRLREEFGLDPGPALRALERRILAGDDPPPAPALAGDDPGPALVGVDPSPVGECRTGRPVERSVPRQLTAAPDRFTGRQTELAALDDILAAPAATRPGLVTISGMPGVGKTALALHWAHLVGEHFPDGQLHAELGGTGSVRPADILSVISRLLRSLGESGTPPRDLAEAAARYRTRLAGRRILLLLDDVRDVEQVRHLLPGSAGCLVLVTSRNRLAGLTARYGAHHLPLEVLPVTEARLLLDRLLGGAPAGRDPVLLDRLADLCGGLPLALRAAATNRTLRPAALDLDPRPGTPAEHRTGAAPGHRLGTAPGHRLGTGAGGNPDRLAELAVPGDAGASVQDSFDRSYAILPPAARRMFRLLGRYCVGPVPVLAAAALAGVDVVEAYRQLEILLDAHLVEPGDGAGYVMHELLRLFAAGLTGPDPGTVGADGGRRLGAVAQRSGRWSGVARRGYDDRVRGRGPHGGALRPVRAVRRRP